MPVDYELLGRQRDELYVDRQKLKEIEMKNGRLWKKFSSVKTGTKLLKDLRDRREQKEAGNCTASGLVILSLPDMCASPIDTCREHGDDAFSLPLCPPRSCYISLCLTDDSCQMTRMNGERKEIRKESTLLSITPDYLKHFPKMLSSVFFCPSTSHLRL